MISACTLRTPSLQLLPAYREALMRGWWPDNVRREVAFEQLRLIDTSPVAFVAAQDDPDARAGPVTLPDGTTVPRLPGFHRWIWDGEFCGVIGFRWQPGGETLPPYVLGHIGFSVVPWKQRQGHAKCALALLLPEAHRLGLAYVELTTDPDNIASQRTILANGGVLLGRFRKAPAFGGGEGLRYRIDLAR